MKVWLSQHSDDILLGTTCTYVGSDLVGHTSWVIISKLLLGSGLAVWRDVNKKYAEYFS